MWVKKIASHLVNQLVYTKLDKLFKIFLASLKCTDLLGPFGGQTDFKRFTTDDISRRHLVMTTSSSPSLFI